VLDFEVIKNSMEVYVPTAAEKQQFVDGTKPTYDWLRQQIGADVVDGFLAAVADSEKKLGYELFKAQQAPSARSVGGTSLPEFRKGALFCAALTEAYMIKALKTISDWTEKIGLVVATFIIISSFLLVMFGGVIFRIVNIRFALYEELSRWCLISMTFIGASVALKRKLHVGMNIIVQHLPHVIAKLCIIAAHLIIIATCIIAGRAAIDTALGARGMTGDIVPVTMMYVKFSLPIGFFMMLIHAIYGFAKIFTTDNIDEILVGN
jgi:TRAP-type C4-dicarboxylate transport system permease small subunit